MKEALVLTAIGADKPGLVERLSQALASCDANWEESRMARLGGRFAGILLATVDRDRAAELERALVALQTHGLRVVIERTEEPAGHTDWRHLRVEVVGQDHPGIVSEVSHALAERGINVEELSTVVESAPMSGQPLFRLTADIASPPAVDLDDLRGHLESLAGDLMVDISLRTQDGQSA
ncbi:MAG: ACT domain-containing protein [Proteobacteria bacterium]|nr:ACT domain-containing protein [Pseudomonadota bacterium]